MMLNDIQLDYDKVGFVTFLKKARQLLAVINWHGDDCETDRLRDWSIIPPAEKRAGWRGLVSKAMATCLWRQDVFNQNLLQHLENNNNRGDYSAPDFIVVAPFHIKAFRSGGAVRIAGIARALSAQGNVLIVSIEGYEAVEYVQLSARIRLVSVPKSPTFLQAVEERKLRYGYYAHFMTVAENPDLLPELSFILAKASLSAHLLVAVTPFAWPMLTPYAAGKNVVYDCHDDQMEFLHLVADARVRRESENAVTRLESDLCMRAFRVVTTCEGDTEKLIARHHLPTEKVLTIQNAVDVDSCSVITPDETTRLCKAVGLNQPVILFVGSEHSPNVDAARWINNHLAPRRKEDLFVVLGMRWSDCQDGGKGSAAPNVVFTGPVSREVKEAVFALSSLALCPMGIGVGSSLKIPDYLAHGKITLSTLVGIRGFPGLETFVRVVDRPAFDAEIGKCLAELLEKPDTVTDRCIAARKYVEEHLSWNRVVEPLLQSLSNN